MNKFSKVVLGSVAAVAITVSAASATVPAQTNCNYAFANNLRLGFRSEAVMNLQKVLNMDVRTQVAPSGVGSAGQETMFFGPATFAAVKKFQSLNGVSPVSGFVGPLTRNVLNQICTTGGTTTTPVSTSTSNVNVNGLNIAASNIPVGVLVAGQASAKIGEFVVNGNGTVTGLELYRVGISNNGTLKNVYLYDGATRLTDASSVLTDGTIRFISSTGIFPVSGSKTITVRADIDSSSSGQTVGVAMKSVTLMGQAPAMITGVTGPLFSIASANTTTISLVNNQGNSNQTVDAGTINRNVFDVTANVGTRSAYLKGMTLRYVGSASYNALSNIRLFVDGVQAGSASGINSNGMLVFDLSATPVTLNTGSRTIQVRADVVGGSSRSFQFQLQNAADLMIEDSTLAGVFVAPTSFSSQYGYNFNVGQGTLTVSKNSSFTATQVVGGASNATIGSFKFDARGEDVKVETLAIGVTASGLTAPAAVTSPYLQNVTVYVNGGAVTSGTNWTSGNLTFNLGSSLIIPAGTSATVEVKADVKDNGGQAYTAGTVSSSIVGGSSIARGQTSQNAVTVSSVTGNTLSITSANVSFGKTSTFVGSTVSPNTTDVKIGSFTLQNSNAEDVRITNLQVDLANTGSALSEYNTLKISETGTSVYVNPQATGNNFSMDVTVPMNSSKTFEVFANVGNVTNGSTITPSAKITYRGVSTSVSTNSSLVAGSAITVNTGTLASITKDSSSPVSQLVVGGSTGNIVTYNVKATNGGINVREMAFSFPTDTVKSIKVGGTTLANIAGSTATVTGLSISVPQGGAGTNVPVEVTYGAVTTTGNGGINSQTSPTTILTLTAVKTTDGTGSETTTAQSVASNGMQLVASKPVLSVNNTTVSGLGNTEVKIGEVTVAADAAGALKVNTVVFDVTNSGALTVSSIRIADGTTTVSGSSCPGTAAANTTTSITCTLGTTPNGYTVAAGTSKVLNLYGTAAGVTGTSGSMSVSGKVTGITWDDINGGGTNLNGSAIYNFPTGSYSVRN